MNTVQRSSTVAHNSEPTWRKEEFIFEFPKGSPQEGLPVFVYLDVSPAQHAQRLWAGHPKPFGSYGGRWSRCWT